MDWYPWYPLDFRRDTYCLSLAEDGAYRRLIDEYMLNRLALPDDDSALARILGIGLPEWLTIAARVRQFFKSKDGRLFHKRCEEEISSQNRKMERFSARGQKAAQKRWSKNNGQHARRMLKNATLHNITEESFLVTSRQGDAEPLKRVGEGKKKLEASPYLVAKITKELGQ